MAIRDLMQQRSEILTKMAQQVHSDVGELARKAEHMAECATDIRGQGYSCFIAAREEFFTTLDKFKLDYSDLCMPFRINR